MYVPLSRPQSHPQGLAEVVCKRDHVFALVPSTAGMRGSPVKNGFAATKKEKKNKDVSQ